MLRGAKIAKSGLRLASEAFKRAAINRDLPMPGSPDSNTTWPSPTFGFRPAPQQQFEFFFSPDKFRQASRVKSLEAAFD